jgi:hypothetical protein
VRNPKIGLGITPPVVVGVGAAGAARERFDGATDWLQAVLPRPNHHTTTATHIALWLQDIRAHRVMSCSRPVFLHLMCSASVPGADPEVGATYTPDLVQYPQHTVFQHHGDSTLDLCLWRASRKVPICCQSSLLSPRSSTSRSRTWTVSANPYVSEIPFKKPPELPPARKRAFSILPALLYSYQEQTATSIYN